VDAFLQRHLQGVSRTYALLIPMLRSGLSEPVGLAYLLMRVIDTYEDASGLSPLERRQGLGALAERLSGAPATRSPGPPIGDTPSERELLRDTEEVLARIAALPPAVREPIHTCGRRMIDGILKMLHRSEQRELPYPAIRTHAETRDYCYCVAGLVGEMICELMSQHLRMPALLALRGLAVELGIGLQLVNILKDSAADARRGRRYLPAGEDRGTSRADVSAIVLAEARACLRRGAEFVLALPAAAGELRCFCGLPIAWGALTLARAERHAGRAKVGRDAVRSSMQRFGRLVDDDGALRDWFVRLLAGRATAAHS
jgi:farnesyl-diphosphate farnesyltransferase